MTSDPRPIPQSAIRNPQSVLTGAEQLRAEGFARLRGRRVGLLTNPTGVTVDLVPLADQLAAAPEVRLTALFAPEHGLAAGAAAGDEISSTVHPRLGVPVHSLYGERQSPTTEQLAELDLLLIDLQDVGARFFTYASTVALVLEACAGVGLPVLLLDRPNPLGGLVTEGPILEPSCRSFIGPAPVPIRHGLTMGELARFMNDEGGYGAALEVLPLRGWRRSMWYDETGLPWVLPSPNLPTFASAIPYPGTCLVEGTTLSEGRGTTLPFEQVGAPWLDADRLAAALNAREIPGVRWRPAAFTPWHGRIHVGVPCGGVQLHPTDREVFRPVEAALHLLLEARALAPAEFAWRPSLGDPTRPFIDLLAGTPRLRESLDAGVGPAEIVAGWAPDLARFAEARRPALLYE
ncbi:MAG: Protein YzbB [uncultured Thermomicrobiales bacterium]|uniref:Protein YzbB n=1 Tax=uncultured Thermomicrobiales bacterium TaxID=1645740 RepID=A0A6J4VMB2_9BACT|nr:MAG: Protein YzbB [uncultured Thermomicrobiales bacterium]